LFIKAEQKWRAIFVRFLVGTLEFSLTLLFLIAKHFFHPAVVQPWLLKRFPKHNMYMIIIQFLRKFK